MFHEYLILYNIKADKILCHSFIQYLWDDTLDTRLSHLCYGKHVVALVRMCVWERERLQCHMTKHTSTHVCMYLVPQKYSALLVASELATLQCSGSLVSNSNFISCLCAVKIIM